MPLYNPAAQSNQLVLPIPSGKYMIPTGIGGVATASLVAPGADTMKMFAGLLRRDATIESLAARVVATSAGGNFKMFIYAVHSTTGWPTGAPLLTSSAQSTTTASAIVETGFSVPLAAGWYWWGTIVDNGTATFYSVLTGNGSALSLTGATTASNSFGSNGISKSLSYASALPTLTGNFTTDSLADSAGLSIPVMSFRTT